MIDPADAVAVLRRSGVTLFTGVPDSLLKEINTVIEATLPRTAHIPAPNEGAAIGVAAGHYLGTGEVALVYLQNSGLGNAVNPLASLASEDIYGLPMVLLIGWRGQPGVPDEPQHAHQGRITEQLLQLLDVPIHHLTPATEDWEEVMEGAVTMALQRSSPVALLVSSGTFAGGAKQGALSAEPGLTRPGAIQVLLDVLPESSYLVATTGYTARELAALRERRDEAADRDFLAVGSMGHAGSIALGVAMGSAGVSVICLDGDGSLAMHMGTLAMIGRAAPANLGHVVFNNGVHESVGGQPTVLGDVEIPKVATACGYRKAVSCDNRDDLERTLRALRDEIGPWLLEVKVGPGTLDDLPRPGGLHERKARLRASLDDD